MVTLFFLVSGESPTLPLSEVTSILEAEGFRYEVLDGLTQVLRIQAEQSCIEGIKSRSALTRICAAEIFCCKAETREIILKMGEFDIRRFIDYESFAVRVRRVRGSSPEIERMNLERDIGRAILQRVKGVKVDLRKPQKTFIGILSDNRFVFGLKIAEIEPKKFVEREPRNRPFSHSAAMPVKLARCMVNLAQPRPGDLVLDPFCGTGSFLVEAGLMGCRVLGFDVLRTMVEGSLTNLRLYEVDPEGLVVADARFIPLAEKHVLYVATDPPYGTSTTTLGLGARSVYRDFLSAVHGFMAKGQRICLAAPKTLNIKKIGEQTGFKHLESHFIYIHRRLTREVAVLERE